MRSVREMFVDHARRERRWKFEAGSREQWFQEEAARSRDLWIRAAWEWMDPSAACESAYLTPGQIGRLRQKHRPISAACRKIEEAQDQQGVNRVRASALGGDERAASQLYRTSQGPARAVDRTPRNDSGSTCFYPPSVRDAMAAACLEAMGHITPEERAEYFVQ